MASDTKTLENEDFLFSETIKMEISAFVKYGVKSLVEKSVRLVLVKHFGPNDYEENVRAILSLGDNGEFG